MAFPAALRFDCFVELPYGEVQAFYVVAAIINVAIGYRFDVFRVYRLIIHLEFANWVPVVVADVQIFKQRPKAAADEFHEIA